MIKRFRNWLYKTIKGYTKFKNVQTLAVQRVIAPTDIEHELPFDYWQPKIRTKLSRSSVYTVGKCTFAPIGPNAVAIQRDPVCANCGAKCTHMLVMKPYLACNPGVMKFGRNCLVYYATKIDGKYYLMTVDHIIPRSKGGSNGRKNLQTMCSICNSIKSNAKVETPFMSHRWPVTGLLEHLQTMHNTLKLCKHYSVNPVSEAN